MGRAGLEGRVGLGLCIGPSQRNGGVCSLGASASVSVGVVDVFGKVRA